MIKSQIQAFADTSSVPGHVADRSGETGVLEADEVRQINLATDHESQLNECLNESAAIEEDDELEEQKRVEAAAAANQG